MPWPIRLGPPPRMITLRRALGHASHSARSPAAEPGLVAAVEIGRARLELGGAGVDPLEHRMHAQGLPAGRDLGLVQTREPGQARVREAHRLELEQARGRRPAGRPGGPAPRRGPAPGSARGTRDRSGRRIGSRATRGPARNAWAITRSRSGVGRPSAARSASCGRSGSVRPSISTSSRPSRPVSSERSAFCSDSANVRPSAMTSPTDFIEVVRIGSVSGNFSNVNRGTLVTT